MWDAGRDRYVGWEWIIVAHEAISDQPCKDLQFCGCVECCGVV
jgi:hypothetical protein